MCEFKSGIILKDRVVVEDTDSHTEMLHNLGIKDDKLDTNHVKFELVPKGDYFNGFFTDIDTWKFIVDQDILPEWFIPEYDEKRARDEVKLWAKERIFVNIDTPLIFDQPNRYFVKNCTDVQLRLGGKIHCCLNSKIRHMTDNSSISFVGNRSVIIRMSGNSRVSELIGSSHIARMHDSSSVIIVSQTSSIGFMMGKSSVYIINDGCHIGRMMDKSTASGRYSPENITIYDNAVYEHITQNGKVNYYAEGVKKP